MREKIVLSERLGAVAAMVTEGNRVCDIGCDHGFVPIYLLQQGISPGALAMDVREGPLEQARIHIKAYGLETLIKARLSDGLAAFRKGEADTLICAGMGGRLMMRILSEEEEKAASFRELILQPQSEIQQFRSFLRGQGYLLTDENMIEEDGKFYPMMKAVKSEHGFSNFDKTLPQGEGSKTFWQQMEDRYGPLLLQRKHPVLYRYLEREARICDEVLWQLQDQGTEGPEKSRRYEEISRQKRNCLRVMRERYGDGYGENQY
ncbi:MAG: class I SAM-dependent methyltransferase [Lachnospiraceae bacterium]|nr:class I SAM-dependent methyltransferase [Lachnospiraceae bacterium]